MNRDQANKLTQSLADAMRNAINKFVDETTGAAPKTPVAAVGDVAKPPASRDVWTKSEGEELYQWLKKRLLDDLRVDPVFVKLLATQPEMIVEIEPRVVTLDATGSLRGRVARVIADGFFDTGTARSTGDVRKELARTGTDPGGGGNLSTALGDMVRDGFLVRYGDGYMQAAGVKITKRELVVV